MVEMDEYREDDIYDDTRIVHPAEVDEVDDDELVELDVIEMGVLDEIDDLELCECEDDEVDDDVLEIDNDVIDEGMAQDVVVVMLLTIDEEVADFVVFDADEIDVNEL